MHHPLEWLATEICGQAVRNLTTDFDLVLTGHVHSPLDLRFITAPRGECLFAPCPVLYDRPYSDSIEFARGIAVGELDTGTSEMRLYYYRYSAGSGGRLLPYSDVYPSGTDCFSVTLGHLPESLASDRPTFLEAVGALQASDAADPTERTVNEDAHGQRVQRLFDRTLVLQDAISPIPLLGPVQASAAAYRVVCRALLSLRTQQAFPDLADVDPLFCALEVVDVAAVKQIYADLQLRGTVDWARLPPLSECPMTALVILLWGLAQYLLAFDDCVSLPAADRPLDVPQLAQSPGNVIDVTLNEARSELVFRLRTRNRDEFHRIAEARYAVDSFLGRVDEMWRAAGLFAPPFRVATHFPIWDERPVDSFQLAVESKPITRLLMGRALYGGRRHIWLRELLQNAHDAITMRRRDDSRYVGCVQVLRQHDHLVRVSDDGVGMTRQHVLAFLATLGRSGWRSLGRDEGREDDAPEVFGRFGIGFASVFSAASAVTVCTRRPGTRSVDGLKVSFSGADRPFFIEPAACAEGTSVDVELREPFSRDEFVEAVRNLFLYLPSEVAVTPDPEMPTSLCEASSYRPKQPEARWETVTATSEAVFGTSPARVTLELIIPELRNRQGRLERPSIYSQPATTLTFAVDGVLARTEDGLQVTKPASTWNWDTKKHLGLRGCLMTVDFERNTAPILPSRSEVDLGPEFDSAVRGLLEQRLPDLIPRLVELPSVATEHGSARNRAIVSALASLGISGEPAGGVVETEAVQSAVAEFYRAECPVAVTSTESRTWVLLDDLDPLECATVTPEKVASTAAFAVYVSPSAFSEMARSVSAPPTVRRSVRGCTEMMSGAASMRDRRGECGWAIASIESRRTMWLRRKDADDVGASADSAVTALQRFAERSLCGPAGVGPDSEVGDRHDGQPHRRPPARRYVLGVEAEHVVLDHAGRRPRRAGWRC